MKRLGTAMALLAVGQHGLTAVSGLAPVSHSTNPNVRAYTMPPSQALRGWAGRAKQGSLRRLRRRAATRLGSSQAVEAAGDLAAALQQVLESNGPKRLGGQMQAVEHRLSERLEHQDLRMRDQDAKIGDIDDDVRKLQEDLEQMPSADGGKLTFEDLKVGMQVRVIEDLDIAKKACTDSGIGWPAEKTLSLGKTFTILSFHNSLGAALLDTARVHYTFPPSVLRRV